jgi:prevent-host-death family protein
MKLWWQLQEAKARLSAVVDLALTEGPQTITRQGEPVAVLLSMAEYERLTEEPESLSDMFARLSCGEEAEIDVSRDPDDFGREIDL